MLKILAAVGAMALLATGVTPWPGPQKRVECASGCSVYNDGGAYGITVGGDGGSSSVTATTGDMALFVDPAGSDSNNCTAAGASACKTIPGAIAKLPTFQTYNTTISVLGGTGTTPIGYAGAAIPPKYFADPRPDGGVNGILVSCSQWVLASGLTGGSTTGTSTTAANGSLVTVPFSFATLTDSTQSWTADELVQFFIRIDTGPGSGTILRPIAANTATTITIPNASWGTAPTASTYSIIDQGCRLISTVLPSNAAGGTTNRTFGGGNFVIMGTSGNGETTRITVDGFKIVNADSNISHGGFIAQDTIAPVSFTRDSVILNSSTFSSAFSTAGTATATFSSISIRQTAAVAGISAGGRNTTVSVGAMKATSGNGTAFDVPQNVGGISSVSSFLAKGCATLINTRSSGRVSASAVWGEGLSGGGIIVASNATSQAGGLFEATGQVHLVYTSGSAVGVLVQGVGSSARFTGAFTTSGGAGSQTGSGLAATSGGRISVVSTSTVTGWTNPSANEVLIIGAAGGTANSTWAGLTGCLTDIGSGTSVCILP